MATVIVTSKSRDKDGVRVLKTESCPFCCVRNCDGKAVPCDLYTFRGSRELCLKDEECQE